MNASRLECNLTRGELTSFIYTDCIVNCVDYREGREYIFETREFIFETVPYLS